MTMIVRKMVGYDNDENVALFFSEVYMIRVCWSLAVKPDLPFSSHRYVVYRS